MKVVEDRHNWLLEYPRDVFVVFVVFEEDVKFFCLFSQVEELPQALFLFVEEGVIIKEENRAGSSIP